MTTPRSGVAHTLVNHSDQAAGLPLIAAGI